MRQRGEREQQRQHQQPAQTPAAVAARVASKRSSTRRSRLRGFWIGTACFLLCIVAYLCCGGRFASSASYPRSRTAKAGLRVAERDVAALGLATQQAEDAATLPNLEELSRTAAPIGAVYLSLLEEVSAAEGLDDGGRTLRQLDVSQHYLASVGNALRLAADVSYTKLKRMLLQEPNAELAMAPTSLVRTTYGWMLSDLFLYGAVLPEYYLVEDDTTSHVTVLLRALNLLSWSSLVHTAPNAQVEETQQQQQQQQLSGGGGSMTHYDIFNWSGGAACRKGPLGAVSKSWMQFCESSFASPASVARRAAATYEELIVLHPDYAPLRLHYAIVFAFLEPNAAAATTANAPVSLSDHAMKALRVIRNDREKLGARYKHTDAFHVPVLALLESYLTPVDLWTSKQEKQLVDALNDLKSCERASASLLSASHWQLSGLEGEYRAPLLRGDQMSALLAKARVHLGSGHEALLPFLECL